MSREDLARRDADDDSFMVGEAIGLGCALEAFSEADEVLGWIEEIPDVCQNERQWERHREKFITLLDRYQEQAHLLDPYIPKIIAALLPLIRSESIPQRHAAAVFATHICKVRKAKVVVKLLPHEVTDLEPVLSMLEKEEPHAFKNWETRYFLLVWMSMLALVPFDLARFDSHESKKPLMERILDIIKTYLQVTSKSLDAAAFLASRFLTRPEIQKKYLVSFMDWCLNNLTDQSKSDIVKIGVLKAMSGIFKQGKRDDLLPHSSRTLKILTSLDLKQNSNGVLRKLNLKLTQRIGLTFLKTRVATWRYQRGSRSLTINLNTDSSEKKSLTKEKRKEENSVDEEDYDIPDELEDVIDELLSGLKDKETVCRWSAAKGIGRVTNRLPKDLADDVVQSILDMFTLRETDAAWHGGCLALAELGRRGLLLPERLKEVVNVVIKALTFDEKKGSFSVGSHIRDAACYVCWSFARAYDPKVLEPYIKDIARSLVTVSIFDREVNCRRAASAAFQENVGRQGTFPNGIDILTKADYFSVGSRMNTYLKLSVYIASFEDYRNCLIDHLVNKKVGHWDIVIREITAMALHNLTPIAREKMLKEVLPKLIENTNGMDLFLKHGSVIAVGYIVHALSTECKKNGNNLQEALGAELTDSIKQIAVNLAQQLSLRIAGGDLIRQALTTFIDQCSQAAFPAHGHDIVELWQSILDDNLSNVEPLVHEKAVRAVPHFVEEYYKDPISKELLVDKRDKIVNEYLKDLDASEIHRRGIALTLGAVPCFFLKGRVLQVIERLIDSTVITKETEKWAEGRRDCILAITNIVKNIGIGQDESFMDQNVLNKVYKCLLTSMDDYTLDRRGDIGAWVREAAMTGLEDLTRFIVYQNKAEKLPNDCISEMMPRLAQQAVEKIDRTRGMAAKLFASCIFMKDSSKIGIPDHKEILTIFGDNFHFKTFAWTVESETFPIFVKLINLDNYRNRVLLGLVVSIGGLTERLVKHASSSLLYELKAMNRYQLDRFCQSIHSILSENHKNDRVTIPMLKFLDQVLTSGFLDPLLQDENEDFTFTLLSDIKNEVNRSGDPNKLLLSCDVLCALLQVSNPQTVKKSLVQISIFLCHKFPRIRKATANKLFEALLTYSDKEIVPLEHLDEVNNMLSETKWDTESVETLRPIRNSLCDILGIPAPTIVKKVAA